MLPVSALHLQYHFGMYTLILVPRGATVTGFAYAAAAIEKVRWLADKAGIDTSFIQGDPTRRRR